LARARIGARRCKRRKGSAIVRTRAITIGHGSINYEIVDKQTGQTKTFTIFKVLLDGSDLYDVAP